MSKLIEIEVTLVFDAEDLKTAHEWADENEVDYDDDENLLILAFEAGELTPDIEQ